MHDKLSRLFIRNSVLRGKSSKAWFGCNLVAKQSRACRFHPLSNNGRNTACVTLHCKHVFTPNLPPKHGLMRSLRGQERGRHIWGQNGWNAHLQQPSKLLSPVPSLWDDSIPPPPRPLHYPLPADVIPGRGHVLHRPPAPTALVWRAGGRSGCLPAARETASMGLLDMADHAVTQ